MKAETRNGYIKRYDDCIKQIVSVMRADDTPADILGKMQVLFNAGKELESVIYTCDKTMIVSNKLQAYENRVANAMGGDFTVPEEEEGDGVAVEEGSSIGMLMEAQSLLIGAYGKIVTENSLAAHVPAVMAIKAKADDMKGVISDVMRISASLS